MDNSLKVLFGFLIGVGVGAATSFLLRSEDRLKAKRRVLERAEEMVDDLQSSTVHKVDKVRDKLVNKVESYADKTKDRIKKGQTQSN